LEVSPLAPNQLAITHLDLTRCQPSDPLFAALRWRNGFPDHGQPLTLRCQIGGETDPPGHMNALFLVEDIGWPPGYDSPYVVAVELVTSDHSLFRTPGRWLGYINFRTRKGFVDWHPPADPLPPEIIARLAAIG
jgi:hypothetical protein